MASTVDRPPRVVVFTPGLEWPGLEAPEDLELADSTAVAAEFTPVVVDFTAAAVGFTAAVVVATVDTSFRKPSSIVT